MKKAIIFDLDGTLWDATENLVAPWNEILHKNGVNITLDHDDLMSFMGKTVAEISAMIMSDMDKTRREEIATQCALYGNDYLKYCGGKLYPKTEETLKKLKEKYLIFIVSNCLDGYIQAFTSYHHLEKFFDDFECGRTGLTKGENIKLVIERNGLNKCVYVGDTESDFVAANFAKIPFIHAAYGFGQVSENTPKINAFSDLVNTVGEVL